jgi:hypothetical protein
MELSKAEMEVSKAETASADRLERSARITIVLILIASVLFIFLACGKISHEVAQATNVDKAGVVAERRAMTDREILVEFGRVLWPFALLASVLLFLFGGMWVKIRGRR